jgi:hypothetical protein
MRSDRRLPTTSTQGNIIIIIIITIPRELGLNRPVSASSNGLFKGLPSHLHLFGL